jgi:hypothetical protein
MDINACRQGRKEQREIILVRWREQHFGRPADTKPGQRSKRLLRQQTPAQLWHQCGQAAGKIGGWRIEICHGVQLTCHPPASNRNMAGGSQIAAHKAPECARNRTVR